MGWKIFVYSILFILLAFASYFLYWSIQNLTAEPVQLVIREKPSPSQPSYTGDLQFYPNMRFAKRILAYSFESSCNQEKREKVRQAMNFLEKETGLLKFSENGEDIIVGCTETAKEIPGHYFIAGEGGPVKIINTTSFYVIEKGKLLLFYKKPLCDNYNIELHELLHVFGFDHSLNKNSVMYNISSCNQIMTNDIGIELRRLYSIEELANLQILNVSAYKHGTYLDFEVSMMNSGLKDAENITLVLYSGERKIESFKMNNLSYGEGSIFSASNVRVARSLTEVRFVLEYGRELDKDNNAISLSLPFS